MQANFLRKKGNLNLWQQTQSKGFEQASFELIC